MGGSRKAVLQGGYERIEGEVVMGTTVRLRLDATVARALGIVLVSVAVFWHGLRNESGATVWFQRPRAWATHE